MHQEIKSIAGMSLGTLFSRITGFVKWAMLGAALGFSPLADAYNLAHLLPTMVYELVLGGILTAVFVPLVVEQFSAASGDDPWIAVSKLINAAILLLAAVTAFCFLTAPWLVDIQTLKVQARDRSLVLFFFLFFIPQILFYGLSALGNGLLNARGRFAMAAFAPVFNNLLVIITLALYLIWPGFGKLGLALGTTAGVAAQALVLAPSLRASGFQYHPVIDLGHPAVRKMIRLSGPVILYVIFNQLNLTVQNNLAIPLKGGVSALQYAFAFYVLPHGLFAVSIGTVLLPGLSDLAVRNEWEGFAQKVSQGIRWSAVVMVPAVAVYVALSQPLVEVLMQRGRFTVQDTKLLATVLSCYALGLFAFTLYLFLNRVFYSLQDTWTPLVLNFIGNLTNSVFNLLTVDRWGVPALALGHALAYSVIAALSLWLIARRVEKIKLRPIFDSLARVAAASSVVALMAAASSSFWPAITNGRTLMVKIPLLCLMLLTMAAFYLAAARLLKVEEVDAVWELLKKKFTLSRHAADEMSRNQ